MQTINIYSQAHLFELAAFSPLLILEILRRSPWQSWGKSIVLIIIPGSNVALSLSLHALHKFIYLCYTHTCKIDERGRKCMHRSKDQRAQLCRIKFKSARCIFKSNNARRTHYGLIRPAFANVTGERKQCANRAGKV